MTNQNIQNIVLVERPTIDKKLIEESEKIVCAVGKGDVTLPNKI